MAFEIGVPQVDVGGSGSQVVEGKDGVGVCFASVFFEDELVGEGAFLPVDISGIVAIAHGSKAEDFVRVAASLLEAKSLMDSVGVWCEADGVDVGIDDEFAWKWIY